MAAQALSLPDFDRALIGPTAVIVGGQNSPGVAKVLRDFIKEKQKIVLKAGVLSNKLLSSKELERLAELPSLEALRAQLLGLLQQPAGSFVRVLQRHPLGGRQRPAGEGPRRGGARLSHHHHFPAAAATAAGHGKTTSIATA